MYHERSQSRFVQQLHRKLSGYLLSRQVFGIDDTGRPDDGLYYARETSGGLLVLSDYHTAFSIDPYYAQFAVGPRQEALEASAAILDAELKEQTAIPSVMLFRPSEFGPSTMASLLEMRGIDLDCDEIVLFDPRQGIVGDPENHPMVPYLNELPPPSELI